MLIFVFFLGLIFLGLPVSFSFVVAGIFYLLNFTTVSPNIIATTTFTGIDNFALLAIPFFIFAGDIMREGGISKRLVSFAKLFFKNSMTAYGTICIVGCAFFGAISGSAVAAVAAIGGIMIPEMIRHRYKREYAGSLASAAGYLGMLIPPSVPIVLYCITSGDSIGETFIAGVVPGLLAMVAQIIVNKIFLKKFTNTPEELLAVEGIVEEPASEQPHGKDLLKVLLEVIPGILMPVIILGGIYAGIFTATEAAAVSIVYGTFVSVVLYKEISLKDIPRVAVESAKTAGKVHEHQVARFNLISLYSTVLTVILMFTATFQYKKDLFGSRMNMIRMPLSRENIDDSSRQVFTAGYCRIGQPPNVSAPSSNTHGLSFLRNNLCPFFHGKQLLSLLGSI